MAAEIIKVVDAVSEAKDVDREVLFEAIENAIESATKKKYADTMDVKVTIDRETGDYKTYRRWMVFADDSRELEDPDIELRMIDAVDVDKNANPGEFVHEEIESVDFGRIGAQIAKQVIVQKVREAEKQKTIELFKDNVGELVSGVVKRMDRNGFILTSVIMLKPFYRDVR
jgi:NusA N-terminal domain.